MSVCNLDGLFLTFCLSVAVVNHRDTVKLFFPPISWERIEREIREEWQDKHLFFTPYNSHPHRFVNVTRTGTSLLDKTNLYDDRRDWPNNWFENIYHFFHIWNKKKKKIIERENKVESPSSKSSKATSISLPRISCWWGP